MRAGLVCGARLRAGAQSFKSSLCVNYFPSWTLQHPISLMLHLQTLSLVSSHLSWLWKTVCFQETFWLGLRFQHCCSQVQELFLLQLLLDVPLHVSSFIAISSPPHFRAPSACTFDRELLFSERALCPFFLQHSPNPAGRGGALPCPMRSSSTELIPLQPLHFPSTETFFTQTPPALPSLS